MAAWLKVPIGIGAQLARVSADAELLWFATQRYSAEVGNDGELLKRDLAVATHRKVGSARLTRAAAELVEIGLWAERGERYELVDWLKHQPAAAVWDDDVQRERWARGKALLRNGPLCTAIKTRDRNLCRYCATRVDWTNRKGANGGTYDHVDPDGDNSIDNVVVACRRCNSRKKDRTPEQASMPLLAIGSNPVRFGSNPDQTSESDSLACARETGPDQTGVRSDLTAPPSEPPSDAEPQGDADAA